MRPSGRVLLAAVLLPAAIGHTTVVGGGGSSRTDCLVVFDAPVNVPPDRPRRYRCTDGDPACDADGAVNGVCTVPVRVCANSSYNPNACSLVGVESITVDHALDNGDPKFDTQFQALQNRVASDIVGPGDPPNTTPDVCALTTTFVVPVRGPFPGAVCRPGRKEVALTAFSTFMMGVQFRDRDHLAMRCDPAGCGPRVFYAGTYDRIQKQVFNQSCALSGCHDSQTHQNNLVLEEGSSYGNLADVTPFNATAAAAGWKRVDAAGASSANSYLYHKITGDLDPGEGVRMPFARPPLDSFLIDIVRLWIEAGAPNTGWVPGTDQ
jgi:hypothetical protein